MTSLRQLGTQIACALGEELFATVDANGRTIVPLDQAGVIAAGRLDLWSGWPDQPERVRSLVGRFLRIRHNELGAPRRFREAAGKLRQDPDSPYLIHEDVSLSEIEYAVARHGQHPLDLAERLLTEAERLYTQARRPLPVAGPGRWTFGWQDATTVELPSTVTAAPAAPIEISTVEKVPEITVDGAELQALADELAKAAGTASWQSGKIGELFGKLRDVADRPAPRIRLEAGGIRLLNAPTGVGKSVLTRLMAIHLARRGIRVAIVVGTIAEALTTAENISSEVQHAREVADDISKDLAALGVGVRCAALVSPRRLEEKALQAASRGEWDRFDHLAYPCALQALTIDGPPPAAPDEPCTSLRPRPAAPDDRVTAAAAHRGETSGKSHACPWLGSCGRHAGFRDAATAEIVVTNHHNLIHGTVPVPVRVDGVDQSRLPVMEYLLRQFPVVLVDEVDRLQSGMFDTGAKQLVLSERGSAHELTLAQLDVQRSRLAAAQDREVLPALSRARYLADQFLNYVLEHDLWLETDPDRPGSGWHVPGRNDRMLLQELFDVQDSDQPTQQIYEQFNALFPDTREINGGGPPRTMGEVARLLRSVVSNDTGRDQVHDITDELHRALSRRVKDPQRRRDVVNALLVRTWLGALQQALTRLTFAVSSPGVELPAARVLADKLGTFVQHATIPYGPLGYLLFGFRVDKVADPSPRGSLSVQAIAGDPHTTVAQLGGMVSLAAAGVERIVLGLSATAFFPGAAREHILAEVTYAMTDADPGAFITRAGSALDEAFEIIQIAGRAESQKPDAIRELGRSLWDQHLDQHLRRLAETDPDRERCLLVGNSYRHAALLAAGMASHVADPGWVAVLVPKDGRISDVALPDGVVRLTIEDVEALPRQHPQVKVCIAPLSLVSRGLNILVPDEQRSALASVWVCVRPPTQLSDAAELLASANAYALQSGAPGPDPAQILAGQRRAANVRLHQILASDPRFTRLNRTLKAEAVAGMLVDLIQLGGRARRGGASVELYLADGAFHDTSLGSDLASLLRFYYHSLDRHQQAALGRIYGSTLLSWFDFAGIDHHPEDTPR